METLETAELLIKLILAVEVLLTRDGFIPPLLGEGGGLPALVLGLQGDAGGDVFGGVGGISCLFVCKRGDTAVSRRVPNEEAKSEELSSWPDIRLGRLDNLSDDFRRILELVGLCGGFSVTKGLEISSGSSSSSWDSMICFI